MEKGDKKTKGGKIVINSYGKLRPLRRKFKVSPKKTKDPLEEQPS
jgi:30S ribosomal protein S31